MKSRVEVSQYDHDMGGFEFMNEMFGFIVKLFLFFCCFIALWGISVYDANVSVCGVLNTVHKSAVDLFEVFVKCKRS